MMHALSGLSGATQAVYFPNRAQTRTAVSALLTCHEHHFAIVGEQQVLVMSEMAVKCLERMGIIQAGVLVDDGTGE